MGDYSWVRPERKEGVSLLDGLPGVQADLLKALKATGKPLVVILISGTPLALPWVKENADAFLVQWYAGEQQGMSLASILTPVKQLKAFDKVEIPAGATVSVRLTVPLEELMIFNSDRRKVLEPGEFQISLGHSSSDIRYSSSVQI